MTELGDGTISPEHAAEVRRRIAEKYKNAPAPEPPPEPGAVLGALLGQAAPDDALNEMLRNPPPIEYLESRALGSRLFYEHSVCFWGGHPKAGKSLLILMQAADMLDDGHTVVYLDFENGLRRFGRRLTVLGVRERPDGLHYIPHPKLPDGVEGWRTFVEELNNAHPGALLVVDSLRSVLQRYGLDVMDPAVIEAIAGPSVAADALTTAILDHSTMSQNAQSKYVLGWNGAKAQVADAVYLVEKEEDFGVDEQGRVSVTVKDDRDGELLARRAFRIGGQGAGNALAFERIDLEAEAAAKLKAKDPKQPSI